MGQLREYIETEVGSRMFFYIPPDRAQYLVYYEPDQFGKKTLPVFGPELAEGGYLLDSGDTNM